MASQPASFIYLRLTVRLKQQVKAAARRRGQSMNQWLVDAVNAAVAADKTAT